MTIYNVRLYFQGDMGYEVEAKDDESAEERAIELLNEDCPRLRLEVNDATVIKSSNQYTAEQELRDDERRHEDSGESV